MFYNKDYIGTPVELRAAYEVQQDLAKICTLKSEIVWDVIGPDQSDLLMKKLECMFPNDKRIYTLKSDIRRVKRNNANVNEIRKKIFKNIWQQRKYTNGTLLHSIVYAMVTQEQDLEKARYSHNYTIHPIFRTRRCMNTNNSAGCCMIFIDEKSRVYQNWSDFLNNNELPIGTMIAPSKGYYTLNKENAVQLDFSLTPVYYRKAIVSMDNFVGAASLIGQTAMILHPAYSIIVIATKTYETMRDYQKMSDQVARGTSTNLNAKLTLTSNVISLTSSVATFGAYMTVKTGNSLSLSANMSIQAINSAATLVNCTKFIITTYDLFTRYFIDGEELEFSDAIAFGTSLILLTNSINNIVITSQIGNIDGNTLRNLLQSKIKAGLTLLWVEMSKNAIENAGNFDIMRLINDIPYKDVLCNIHTIYNNLSQTGFLTTLSVIGTIALEILPGLVVKIVDEEITEFDLIELTKHYGYKFVEHITNSHNFIDVLNGMGVYFSTAIVQLLMNETRFFIDTTADAIYSQQNTFLSTEMVLYKMFSFTIKNYKNYAYEFLDKRKDDIQLAVVKYFQSFNPKPTNEIVNKHNCDICDGYFYLVNI